MQRHIIYIINPVAGSKPKNALRELIEKRTAEKGIKYQVFPSVASGDYAFLLPVIREEKVTDIVVAGGDGTVSQVVSSLMNSGPDFGIIPCGSGNGLAYTAKIPKQPSKALDIVFNNKVAAIDGFFINNQFACMLCGLGFDARIAHDFARQPKRGLTTYVRQVVKNFFSAHTYSFDVDVNNCRFSLDAFFISVANSNQFGNNFTIAPSASLSDGLLDIVIVTDQSKLSILLQILKQITGRNKLLPRESFGQTGAIIEQKKGVIYFQSERLTIVNRSQAPLHIDGDPAETPGRLEIAIKKKCFRLIQP